MNAEGFFAFGPRTSKLFSRSDDDPQKGLSSHQLVDKLLCLKQFERAGSHVSSTLVLMFILFLRERRCPRKFASSPRVARLAKGALEIFALAILTILPK